MENIIRDKRKQRGLSQEELASQIVMIDINKDKAEGEVMDIEQGIRSDFGAGI